MTRLIIPYDEQIVKFDKDPMPAWGIKNGTVWFRCACGTVSDVSRWTIARNGDVSPSFNHTLGGACDFHEFVTFADYHVYKSESE